MKGKIEVQNISLGGLAPVFESEDRRCIFLCDKTGNAYTFFKYKAKLIDLSLLNIEANMGKRDKADIMEQIRKGLTYGIKSGQCVILHLGQNNFDCNAFLKDQKFWNPKQLFRSPQKMDDEWYRANVMKPTDKDTFGNEGTLYPSEKFIIFLSFSKEVAFEQIKWLEGTEENFRGLNIS